MTVFLYVVSGQTVSVIQGLCTFALLAIPWWSFALWKKVATTTVPLFAILAFMHWVYFAVPLFFGARVMPVTGAAISDSTLDRVLLSAVLGVVCLGLGMNTRIVRHLPEICYLIWPGLNTRAPTLWSQGVSASHSVSFC